MGWWESYDGTVIGDEPADIVDEWLDKLISNLVKKYPTISRDQVLHTIAFCSGYLKHFDQHKESTSSDKILTVMTVKQMRRWKSRHLVPPDMSKQVAPNTELLNVHNPFTDDVV